MGPILGSPRPLKRSRSETVEKPMPVNPHLLAAFRQEPSDTFVQPVEAQKLYLSLLKEPDGKNIIIACGNAKWSVHDFILRKSCTKLSYVIEMTSANFNPDTQAFQVIKLKEGLPLAVELVIIYWYTRDHHVTREATIQYANNMDGIPSQPGALTRPRKQALMIEMALVAQSFGDTILDNILVRKFRSQLPHLSGEEFVDTVKIVYGNEYASRRGIKIFKDLLALYACREKLDRVWHPDAMGIHAVMGAIPEFKDALIKVEALCDAHK